MTDNDVTETTDDHTDKTGFFERLRRGANWVTDRVTLGEIAVMMFCVFVGIPAFTVTFLST